LRCAMGLLLGVDEVTFQNVCGVDLLLELRLALLDGLLLVHLDVVVRLMEFAADEGTGGMI